MNTSLANKYRPREFSDVVSQESVVKILEKQIQLKQYKNAYLFCGASGVGKTSLCRILASKINGNLTGIQEIDAASNNGVDNIRSIVKSAQERSVTGEYKIFILDEVQVLSNQSWQALLKCLEEPPAYTIFMLCTTESQKVPATIVNRCQKFNLSKISNNKILDRLAYICKQEGFTNYEESIVYISKISNGGLRDAISTLEKVASYSEDFDIKTTLNVLGNYSYQLFFNLANSIIDSNQAQVLQIISDIYYQGQDLKVFVDKFFAFCLDITKYCLFKNFSLLEIPESFNESINSCINFDTPEKYYIVLVNKLLELKSAIKNDTDIKSTVEAYFLNMSRWE